MKSVSTSFRVQAAPRSWSKYTTPYNNITVYNFFVFVLDLTYLISNCFELKLISWIVFTMVHFTLKYFSVLCKINKFVSFLLFFIFSCQFLDWEYKFSEKSAKIFFYKEKKQNSSLSNQLHNSPFWKRLNTAESAFCPTDLTFRNRLST